MDRIRRTERLAAMTQMLINAPNRSLALSTFCETFDTAKSSASEDLDIIRTALKRFHLGTLETLPGAAGGHPGQHMMEHRKAHQQHRREQYFAHRCAHNALSPIIHLALCPFKKASPAVHHTAGALELDVGLEPTTS